MRQFSTLQMTRVLNFYYLFKLYKLIHLAMFVLIKTIILQFYCFTIKIITKVFVFYYNYVNFYLLNDDVM